MSILNCCRFRQASSGDLPNSRVLDLSEEHPQTFISTATPTSSRSADDLPPIRDIFAASNRDSDLPEHQGIADSHRDPKRAMLFGVRHKESNGRLHEIARVLRSRISRESNVSKRSSKRSGRTDLSEEDFERRKELKRALHRRLEEELLQDRTASENGYDTDAVPIKTPNGTWGPAGGGIHDLAGRPRHAIGRFEPPSPSLGRGSSQRNHLPRHIRQPPVSVCAQNRIPKQKDQVLKKSVPNGIHDGPSSEIPSPIITPQQSMYLEAMLEHQDQHFHLERENLSLAQPSHLHPSRSANFIDLVPDQNRNHVATASRRRSIQNISHVPDRISSIGSIPPQGYGYTQWPNKWSRGPSRLLSPSIEAEEIQHYCDGKNQRNFSVGTQHDNLSKFTGPEEMNDSYEIRVDPGEKGKANSQRSQSFSLERNNTTQAARDSASKVLVPSVSLPCLDKHAQHQQLTAGNGGSLLYCSKTRRERQKSNSGGTHLKVPDASTGPRRDVASSRYSSQNDSFASSRRSSLMRIQNLSERLEYLKNHPENEGDHTAWSSALDVSKVPGSQFGTVEIEKARRRTTESARSHLSAAMAKDTKSATGNSRNSSVDRDFIDMKIGSRHENAGDRLHPDSHRRSYTKDSRGFKRRSSSVFDRTAEWCPSNRRRGFGYDFVLPADEEASSIWEKALQAHADQSSSLSTSLRSISPARSRQSLEKRLEGNKTPRRRPLLRRGIRFSSSGLWKHWQASSGTERHSTISMNTSRPGNRTLKSHIANPPASWSRFPSHTLAERCFSPAGKKDNVSSRDFATEFQIKNGEKKGKSVPFGKTKKSRSMTLGRSMKNTLSRIYNIDIRRLNRGHRSSISVEGRLEYPELEILPHPSSPPQPLDAMSKHDIAAVLDSLHPNSSQQSIVNKPDPTDETFHGARVWSKLYEDCVHYPADGDSWAGDALSDHFHPHTPSESSRREDQNDFSPRSSADMRNSTLDFQQSLQDHEAKAKERALQAADDAWGQSPAP